jgi:hypothetical protein
MTGKSCGRKGDLLQKERGISNAFILARADLV